MLRRALFSGYTLAVFAPRFVLAQDMSWINSLSGGLAGFLGSLVPLLIALALLVFIWGVVLFISKSGDEKVHEEGRRKMVWGIVALFVIVSVWGLVTLLQTVVGAQPVPATAPRISL